MSNSKMDTWPLQVRLMVERKARAVAPDSTGWQVHKSDSNSAQGSIHRAPQCLLQKLWAEALVSLYVCPQYSPLGKSAPSSACM